MAEQTDRDERTIRDYCIMVSNLGTEAQGIIEEKGLGNRRQTIDRLSRIPDRERQVEILRAPDFEAVLDVESPKHIPKASAPSGGPSVDLLGPPEPMEFPLGETRPLVIPRRFTSPVISFVRVEADGSVTVRVTEATDELLEMAMGAPPVEHFEQPEPQEEPVLTSEPEPPAPKSIKQIGEERKAAKARAEAEKSKA
jgi:hypothetical protein